MLSPCSALLLPSFFGYAFRDPRHLFARTTLFYLGLCVTLVPLGAGSAAVSGLFYGERDLLIAVAGWLIIAFGVAQIAGLGISLGFLARLEGRFSGRTDAVSVFALGAVYGLAGFCSGPILGAVLTVAATGGAVRGALLLAVYALGMALPLFLLALLWDRFDLGGKAWLRGRQVRIGPVRLHTTSTASGLLFILIGALFLRYDGTASLFGGALFEDQAYRAQQWLAGLSGSGADLALFGALGAALIGAGAWRWHRDRRAAHDKRIEPTEPTEPAEAVDREETR
nr:cytochrome c biogenesis CcdA family protein [Nocardiopsis mwathae]